MPSGLARFMRQLSGACVRSHTRVTGMHLLTDYNRFRLCFV